MVGLGAPALVVVLLGGGYALALSRRPASLPAWGVGRPLAWATGVLLVTAAVSPAVDAAAAADHRAHMVQHLLLGMYAPLALVLAAPVTLLLGSLPRRAARSLVRLLRSVPVRVLTHPVVAATASTGGLFVLYLTPLYTWSTTSGIVRALVLVHLLLAGWAFTWSVVGPDPVPGRPRTAVRLGVLVVAAGAHAYLAKRVHADAAALAGAAGGGNAEHAGQVAHGAHAVGDGHGVAALEQAARWMYYGGDVAEVLLVVLLLVGGWHRAGAPRPAPAVAGGDERR